MTVDWSAGLVLLGMLLLLFFSDMQLGTARGHARGSQETYDRILNVYAAARSVMYSSTVEYYQVLIDRSLKPDVDEEELRILWQDWFENRKKAEKETEKNLRARIKELEKRT